MIATTGAQLLPPEALRELRTRLIPQATVFTPNIPEARFLLAEAGQGEDLPLRDVTELEAKAKAIQSLGCEWALVKGGHAPFKADYTAAATPEESEVVVDVLAGKEATIRIETPFQDSKNTHGTGCSLACEDRLLSFQELVSEPIG